MSVLLNFHFCEPANYEANNSATILYPIRLQYYSNTSPCTAARCTSNQNCTFLGYFILIFSEPANYEPNDWQYGPYPGQLDNYPRPAAYPPPRPANYRNPAVGYGRQPAAGRPRGRNQRRRSNLSPPRTVYVRGALQFE